MPVLVTSKFDEDPIKNEHASLATPFSHYKSMGNFLEAQGHSKGSGPIWPVLVTCKFDEDRIKTEGFSVETSFSHYKSMGAGNHILMESAPEPKGSLFPIPLMIHIKFDQDWPTDFGDSISILKIYLIHPQGRVTPK